MLISDRVRMIMKSQNLNASEFADKIDVKRSNLSHILSGRNKPSLDFLTKLLAVYPKVNASWLILGENNDGEYKGDLHSNSSKRVVEEAPISIGIPDSVKPQVENNVQEIDRIVIFYKNGSFTSYSPE